MDADTRDGLDLVLGWNAVKVGRVIGARITTGLADHGIGLVQFGVLSCLADGAALTSAEIARAVFVRPQSMAQVLDGMEEQGLIHREGIRSKGRRNPVQLTVDGERALETALAIALASNDLTSLGLDRAESDRLNDLLLTVIRAAEDTPDQHTAGADRD